MNNKRCKRECHDKYTQTKPPDLQHRDVFRARNPTLHHGILKANPQLSVAVGRDLDMRQRDVSGGVVGLVDQGRGRHREGQRCIANEPQSVPWEQHNATQRGVFDRV